MSQNFIHKYKPHHLNETHIDEDIIQLLTKFIENNKLNLVIYGPSNSGKTTILNSILHDYFNIPRNKSLPYNNILFINCLKEQGINYFRTEMKTFCKSPSMIQGKKKVVYIDDIDIVNEQYQQIFRTYIDKYNNNVQFLCSCSTVQKIVASLQSRLTTIKIPTFSYEVNKRIMDTILKKEQIQITDDCVDFLLSTSNNCIRTIINNLEKLYLYKSSITFNECKQLCFHVCIQHFDSYVEYVKKGQIKEGFKLFNYLYDLGYSVIDILEFFLKYIKSTTLLDETRIYESIILISKYIVILNKIHENKIELSLFTYDFNKIIQ